MSTPATPEKHKAIPDEKLARRIVHEIRNPLNAIRMQTAVIRRKLAKPTPENIEAAGEQLERIEAEVMRLEGLASMFLELGGTPEHRPETISLPHLIEEVAAFVRPELDMLGLTLTVSLPEGDAEGSQVCMDRARLCQVLRSLIENARNAIEGPGVITLELECNGHNDVIIRVRDTGRGIPAEELSLIFEPFYSTTNGTGMGLAIARQIIESANGRIDVESELDGGTCFQIALPSSAR